MELWKGEQTSMKTILITGANSFIGRSVENYLMGFPGQYKVDTVDLKNNTWNEMDFSGYDTVFHVAAIVHKRETPGTKSLYRKVNLELSVNVGRKARTEGVKQFVFMSSMSVYGRNNGRININTTPNPNTYYGKTKWRAELTLNKLANEKFHVAIIRPPMVYGEGCKGNYIVLKKFALKSPLFPDFKNERSMLHINKLCEFIRTLIEDEKGGIFFPQNEDYVCTAEMVREIAEENNRKIWMTRVFNPLINLGLILHVGLLEKVFGSLTYEKNM